MSTRPDPGSFAEAMYNSMVPMQYAEDQNSWSLLSYLGALGQMLQTQDYLAHSPDGKLPPWYNLTDIDACPDVGLPWLGQMVGVRTNTNLPPDVQRQFIRAHIGWGRGRPATIAMQVRQYLVGSGTVDIDERNPDAYSFVVSTYEDETPSSFLYSSLLSVASTYQAVFNQYDLYSDIYGHADPREEILAAIMATKPGGLIVDYQILPGSPAPFVYQVLYDRGYSYGDIWQQFQTYANIH
jgi:hypothetical protein